MPSSESFVSIDRVDYELTDRRQEVLDEESDSFCIHQCCVYIPSMREETIEFYDKCVRSILSKTKMDGKSSDKLREEINDQLNDIFEDDVFRENMLDYMGIHDFGAIGHQLSPSERYSLFPLMIHNAKLFGKKSLDDHLFELGNPKYDREDIAEKMMFWFCELVVEKLDYKLIVNGRIIPLGMN